jgi:hypothetical protein
MSHRITVIHSLTHNNEGETSNMIYRLQIKLLKIEYNKRISIIEYRSPALYRPSHIRVRYE